jgi:hypothetical protein
VTNPPQGPYPPYGQPPVGPGQPEPPTQHIPQQGPQQIPPPIPAQAPPPPPSAPPWPEGQTQHIPAPPAPPLEGTEPPGRGWLRDPVSVVLSVVIVVALALAALLGGEFYARHRADTIVASAVSCVVQDSAKASFGMRPFLLQHFSHRYQDMRVETAGNQIREAKGMKLQLRLDDVQIHQTADSAGTLGALDADVTWSADGIRQTVAGMIPLIGGLVSGVTPDASAGTLELQGPLGTVTIKPTVANGGLALEVLKVTGLGFNLPRETVQPALDTFTDQLTKNLPMGIHADSVEVTDSGVQAKFVTRNATIPNGQQDPCFAGV